MRKIGRVREVWRYPVSSLGGETLASITVSPEGIAGDRRFALFDPETGRASALVSANYLTGVRTGAASAIATKYLSRPDSTVLGILGARLAAGHYLRLTRPVDR